MNFSTRMKFIVFTVFIFRLETACANCGPVVIPPYAIFSVNGSSIEFKCIEGYDLMGDAKMICQADGIWSPSKPPTCQIKSCGEFSDIPHGTTKQEVSTSGIRNSFGSTVHVQCDSGYILNGFLRVKCQADGTWEEIPSCVKGNCPPYPGLNSSCIARTFLFHSGNRTNLKMRCREDFSSRQIPDDNDGVECIDGKWKKTKEVLACYCDCLVKPDPERMSINGTDKGNIRVKHGSNLNWTCKTGYEKDVKDPLVCNDGNMKTPVCAQLRSTAVSSENLTFLNVIFAVFAVTVVDFYFY